MSLLSIRNLTTVFHAKEGEIRACNNIDLDIAVGKSVGIIGETGCGKSVLGMSILRLLPRNVTTSGEIWYKNQNLLTLTANQLEKIRGTEIALLPQSPSTSLNPVIKTGLQITEGLQIHRKMKPSTARRQALEMLRILHLPVPEKKYQEYPHQMSGGMKQRILAAISITGQPSLLIADEPTKGLDAVLRAQVVELLQQLIRETGASLLLITHDLKVAARLCDEIGVMYAGEVIERGPAQKVLTEPEHHYTKGLLASLPDMGLCPIPGSSPSLLNQTTGCKFYPRCSARQEACRINPVPLQMCNGCYVRCLYSA
ncbi:MAG: ABC transporter ATP-binding protein [Syntrophomonadaceae bacterium]|nr:ABC transporter ATP-binding protein [Syntrophomonadaceae bacterium]